MFTDLKSALPPGYITSRERLFVLSHAFANLPEAVREGLSRPEAMYSFGWSHGKEVMNGVCQRRFLRQGC